MDCGKQNEISVSLLLSAQQQSCLHVNLHIYGLKEFRGALHVYCTLRILHCSGMWLKFPIYADGRQVLWVILKIKS